MVDRYGQQLGAPEGCSVGTVWRAKLVVTALGESAALEAYLACHVRVALMVEVTRSCKVIPGKKARRRIWTST